MPQQTMSIKKNGFVLSSVSKSKDSNYSPIYGYRDMTVTTLEEAVKDVVLYVPGIEAHVSQAKRNCYQENTELTLDESAAIYLYTMPTLFHSNLNSRLRTENRDELEPWFAFLKLFITALGKLPSLATIVWRGVAIDISSKFVENLLQTWWTVNSCSTNPRVVELYLGGTDTIFGIEVIHGKDISKYSACPDEQEVVLMPGTRVRVMGQPLEVKDKPYIISLKECGAIPEGKHVMLSYDQNSRDIVSRIHQSLQEEHIPTWFNEKREMTDDMYNSLADGVENAAIVCCFVTEDYEKSDSCKLELQYAYKRHKQIILCLLNDAKAWKSCEWLEPITTGVIRVDFQDVSEPNIHSKARELIDRINEQPPGTEYRPSNTSDRPSYLFELIKYEYRRNSRIERFMNPSKSFPIAQSYINLAIVNAKEQQEKEKQLRNAQPGDAIMSSFEEIYGTKTAIDVKNIFEPCKNAVKQVLVLGRAGIGKSTFCQYVTYHWAMGSFWSQYELLALIPLRCLTVNRYPPDNSYSLIDLVKKEVVQSELSEKDESLLEKQFDAKKTLWILDGYDEIVQNVPPHLQNLFKQLLKTPHHILTSRPYLNILSYDVQMEITGFTDKNIPEYVQQFFDQMKDNAPNKSQTLMNFLRSNPSVWGVAHIPINLELICSLWSNEEWSQTEQLTITTLYSMLIEWLCRRYLRSPDNQVLQLSEEEIDQRCQNELAFLESVAFNAMENNTIIIRPSLLQKTLNETKLSAQDYSHILSIGILKSFDKHGTGTQIEMKKDHYFVHLSFQEYFAARYLVNALKGPASEKAMEFIQRQKYNQRYALVFSFASGLFSASNPESCMNIFWDTLLGKPLDLVGIRHMQLVIVCLEETSSKFTSPRRAKLLEWIAECIKYNCSTEIENVRQHLLPSLQRAPSVACDSIIMNILMNLLQCDDPDTECQVLLFISELKLSNPSIRLITLIFNKLNDRSKTVQWYACQALGMMGEKAANNDEISQLVSAPEDTREGVRIYACIALEKIGEKPTTNKMISKLVSALGDKSENIRIYACEVLGKMSEKAATKEVIHKLVTALGDESEGVREEACWALGRMAGKAVTNEVISQLASALVDKSENIRIYACIVLGRMGETAATNEVISQLVSALGDTSEGVRIYACIALGKIAEKAATNEVIRRAASALGDESENIRIYACKVLGRIGETEATNEVISQLVSALGDKSQVVRKEAFWTLGKMTEKGATNEVIRRAASALGDKSENIRIYACKVLGRIGETAATNEVISQLVGALGDESQVVRKEAFWTLRKMTEKGATNEVISQLVSALGDKSENIRIYACIVLGRIGETAATNEVISQLVSALGDESQVVRKEACWALVNIAEKVATNEVISKVASALGDKSENIRIYACIVLGRIGETAATNEVISQLVSALGDESQGVREKACWALVNMAEKVATNGVISKVASALGDKSENIRIYACEVLGKMGETAATNEVISQLVSALGDESRGVREKACWALVNMAEKVATNGVISKVASALGDKSENIRIYACEVLGKMGEKAGTNEVISQLVSALGDESRGVREKACWALVNMAEKVATNGVISKVASALGDKSENIRINACEVLGKMGEKAGTNEVISQLVSALGDESQGAREKACWALVNMAKKAATNEVISKVGSALGDESQGVRKEACWALGKMTEEAATNGVISKVASALGDKSENIRIYACEVLGRMGEKGATNEVISQLVSALGDESQGVREKACWALVNMAEKAATNGVISKVASALGDKSENIRINACEVLGKMGEKAATNEVISQLVSALVDVSKDVSIDACIALGKMGEKAANNEMISKLESALGDKSNNVRRYACVALGMMSEKAATNEVIDKLVSALKDKSEDVKMRACDALGMMGEKAATNEVISTLVTLVNSTRLWEYAAAEDAIGHILSSSSVLIQLDPKIIANLCLKKNTAKTRNSVSVEQLINVFVATGNPDWLPVMTRLALQERVAVTVTEEKLVVYDSNEPLELPVPCKTLFQQVIEAFNNLATESHLSFEMLSQVRNES